MRRLRTILLTIGFAVAGAVAGRMAANAQRRAAGDDRPPGGTSLTGLGPQAVIPGLIAATRVGERPWSLLHIPPWLAAGVVNFIVAAMTSASPDDGPESAPPARTIHVEGVPVENASPAAASAARAAPGSGSGAAPTTSADPPTGGAWTSSDPPASAAPGTPGDDADHATGATFTRFS